MVVLMAKLTLKGFRITEENLAKLKELQDIYKATTEAQAINLIISEIYELKKSKALVPYEELEKKDLQLQRALFELGKLQGILQEKEKGFFSRLFGLRHKAKPKE